MRQPLGAASSQSTHGTAAARQSAPVDAVFTQLTPVLSAVWIPSITSNLQSVEVPVHSAPGTRSDEAGMSRVQYTVAFTRKPAYVLRGSFQVAPAASFSSSTGAGSESSFAIKGATVTLFQGGQMQDVPGSAVTCDSSNVSGSQPAVCTFAARLFAFGDPPAPGAAVASVQVQSFQSTDAPLLPIKSAPMAWDFASVQRSSGGQRSPAAGARFASTGDAQQFLEQRMAQGPSGPPGLTATVSNYFERGPGRVLPAHVQGAQPAAKSVLADSASFTYTALLPDLSRDDCGKKLQLVSSATVEATTDGLAQEAPLLHSVDVQPIGCGSQAGAQPGEQPSGTDFMSAGSAGERRGSPARVATEQAAMPAAWPVPGIGDVQDVAPPQGVFYAASGTQLCGAGTCPPSKTCIDNAVCCNPSESRCGSTCCGAGNVCVADRCMPSGSQACGSSVCGPQQQCMAGRCCGADNPICGTSCCDAAAGETCVAGACMPKGSRECGAAVCGPTQTCVAAGLCCGAGETSCAGRCCAAGHSCMQGQCVGPGSTQCAGGIICGQGSFCASGQICCPVGATFCAGSCCGGGQTCQGGRCIGVGETVCGSRVCSPDQVCSGGVCCQQGEVACAGACCSTAGGMACIQGLCVPRGSQPCGATTCPWGSWCANSLMQLCCEQGRRACRDHCCDHGQVCNWQNQCVPWDSTSAVGMASQRWPNGGGAAAAPRGPW